MTPVVTCYYQPHELFSVCEVNGSKFALFNQAITSQESIRFDLSDYNVVFLAPIQTEKNISIKAMTVVAIACLEAQETDTQGRFISCDSLSETQREAIVKHFVKGIDQKHGPTIVDGLISLAAAVLNRKEPSSDITQAADFFQIACY